MIKPKEYKLELWTKMINAAGVSNGFFKVYGDQTELLYDIFYKENGIIHLMIRANVDKTVELYIGNIYGGDENYNYSRTPFVAGDYSSVCTKQAFFDEFINKPHEITQWLLFNVEIFDNVAPIEE